jgi:transposase
MRGDDRQQGAMFSYISPEQRVSQDHPLRPIRLMVDEVLREMSPRFDRMYAQMGRPSIAPEKLLRALLLQILYSIRSERLLMEQLDYNLLFRWFVGLNMDEGIWVPTVFSKNRDRLLEADVAQAFFAAVLRQIRQRGWLSDEHFSVDGTLLEAWASQKSFQKKDDSGSAPTRDAAGNDRGNVTVNFHGEKRSNQTHQSRTDPEALLSKKGKGKEAKLCYGGHVLIDNGHGLVVNTVLTQAYGRAEPDAALWMAEQIPGTRRVSLAADKGYDQSEVVKELRGMRITPHVAQKQRSAVDARTTRHGSYHVSQRVRKRVEEVFGWMKTIGLMRKLRHRGLQRVGWMFTFTAAAYNLVRARNLSALPRPS